MSLTTKGACLALKRVWGRGRAGMWQVLGDGMGAAQDMVCNNLLLSLLRI